MSKTMSFNVTGTSENAEISNNSSYKKLEKMSGPSWRSDLSDPSQMGGNLSDSEHVRSNIISAELEELPDGASLDELITIIGPLTRDRGAIMRAVAAEELEEFGDLAAAAWRAREYGSESVLSQQQEYLHRHYGRWSARMEARAEKCRQIILQSLPEFNVDQYLADADYLRRLVLERNGEQFSGRVRTWKQNNRDHLAYLRTQIERLEAEHEELRSQLVQLREKHRTVQEARAARELQLIEENDSIEKECKETKTNIAENTKKIDMLLLQLDRSTKDSVARRLDFDDEEPDNTGTEKPPTEDTPR